MKKKKSKKQRIRELEKRVEALEKIWENEKNHKIEELKQQLVGLECQRTLFPEAFKVSYNPYGQCNSFRKQGL